MKVPARFPFQAAAVSLEGALLGADGKVSRGNASAVAQLSRLGVQVVLVSRADFEVVAGFHDQLQLGNGPLVCYGGAWALARDGKEIWHSSTLELELVSRLLKLADGLELKVFYHNSPGVILVRERNEQTEYWESARGFRLTVAKDLGREGVTRTLAASTGPVQLDLLGTPEKISQAATSLHSEFGSRLALSISRSYLQLRPVGISKSQGMASVAHKLGLSPQKVVAFGGNEDDASLLAWAGLGVAAGYAAPSCKEAAGLVTEETDRAHAFADSVMLALVH